MKASQQAIERGVKDFLFIDYKRRSGHFDVTTVASIKEITEKVLASLSFLLSFDFIRKDIGFNASLISAQDKLSLRLCFHLRYPWMKAGFLSLSHLFITVLKKVSAFSSFVGYRAVTVCSTSPRTPLKGSTAFTFIQLLYSSATKTQSRSSKYHFFETHTMSW